MAMNLKAQFKFESLIPKFAAAFAIPAFAFLLPIFPVSHLEQKTFARFEDYDIRVIRPRYFSKRNRLELGTQLSVVMNQTFIYTYMASGILDYHFSEFLAVELFGSYGFSLDKEDKSTLESGFDIQTQIIRTEYETGGALIWTPMYGKYQIPSGHVVYFDSFFSFGAGMTGVAYNYDHCVDPSTLDSTATATGIPEAQTVSYPTYIVGAGQRFFMSKSTSLRWDIKDHIFNYDMKDGSCDPDGAESDPKLHQNVTLQFGISRFF